MRASFLKLLVVGLVVIGAHSSANADPITLQHSNSVFCSGVGNNTGIPVTLNSNCGQTSITNVTGAATTSGPGAPTSGNYTLTELANNPAFTLLSPSTVGNTTTFSVTPNAAQFSPFVYKSGSTTFLQGTIQFTKFTQTTSSTGGNPFTTGIGLFSYSSGTPQFNDFVGGGLLTVHFDFGGGEELINLFHQTGSTSGSNWQGVSGKEITDGTLTPVPEPSMGILVGITGLIGLGGLLWRRSHRR
jgi:hypothetical protein